MPDPSYTRYFGIPGISIIWGLAIVCFFLFVRAVVAHVRTLLKSRPESRWDHPIQRLKLVIVHVLGQGRLLREPLMGVAHLIIFWSFVAYALGFFWNLVRALLPFLPIPYPDEVSWMRFALLWLGIAGLAGVVVAAVRRYFFTPQGLERSVDASIILSLITIILVSSLVGQWARGRVESVAMAMWWLHMVVVLGFLAYLPRSKHLHLLASPFSVFFGSLQPGQMPAESEGASRKEEFTWRQLLTSYACAECGRCERVCPAHDSEGILSPKELVHAFKEMVRAGNGSENGKKFVGDVVSTGEIWACTTCMACSDRCPVFNEHIPLIVEMRRYLLVNGELDANVQQTLTNLTRYGNSFGSSPRARAKWTDGLGAKLKDARKEPVKHLWFVGDYASFDPRVQAISRSVARVFAQGGLDFGILYEAEQNSGNDVRRLGEEGLYQTLRDKNKDTLSRCNGEVIVTTDPHTYHALKNEYEWHNGRPNILHYTELLDQMMERGELTVRHRLDTTVTYHDPCYLGRYNGIYDPPRRLLRRLGVRLIEMPRHGRDAYCCGAGGGRIWMEDAAAGKPRPSENRVREAATLEGVQTLIVTCPKDLVMFQDAVKTTGLEGRLVVKDLIELVEEATTPEPSVVQDAATAA